MIQPIVLFAAVAAALLLGAVGGHAVATRRLASLSMPLLNLPDEVIAHIAHEAGRAYEQSLGIVETKTWYKLTPNVRAARAARIALLRRGGSGIVCKTLVQHRLELAILTLIQPMRD